MKPKQATKAKPMSVGYKKPAAKTAVKKAAKRMTNRPAGERPATGKTPTFGV